MINFKFSKLQKTKLIGSSYFIAVGLINFIDTLVNRNDYILRDFIILVILCLPLIINKRLFYLGYGLVAAPVILVMLILFVFLQNPFKTDIYPPLFFFGCLMFTLGLLASMTLIHVGTYTKAKHRFRIL
jgi:hypothetical protein